MWWLLAGGLVVAELLTGSFYLLMLALGASAGAVAAHMGMGSTPQVVVAAVLGASAVVGWHLMRKRHPQAAPSESNRDVNLDIGQRLHVAAWDADGSARVPYRGTSWSVRFSGAGVPQAGDVVIVAVSGSELQVAPAGAR